MMAEQENVNTEMAQDRENEPAEDVKEEVKEEAAQEIADTQEENIDLQKQLDDVTMARDDYKLIASHYLPKGVDIEKERGRITRAGDYEPVKSDRPSPERQVVAQRKAQVADDEKTAMDKIREQKKALGLTY